MASRIVAIHQPNFFPWLGYFNKLALADIFIVLDNVQFPKTGGTWMNRVQVLVNGHPDWVSAPIVRAYHGVRPVREMKINDAIPWRSKFLRTIEMSYGRAPYFHEVFSLLSDFIQNPTDSLADFNLAALRAVALAIGLDPEKLVLGSTLNCCGHATDLLISLVQSVGGTAYLCGGGSKGYQEDEKFGEQGIQLVYQAFDHPRYPQGKGTKFCPGLSIIDAMMYCGYDGVRRLIAGQLIGGSNHAEGNPIDAFPLEQKL